MARWRTALLLALVAGLSIAGADSFEPVDASYFGRSGDRLFSRDALNVFSDPALQVGPLQLVLSGTARLASRWTPLGFLPALSLLAQVGFAALLIYATRGVVRHETGTERPWAEMAVVLAALAWGQAWSVYGFGHPAQGLVPLLWVCAATKARSGHPIPAGLLLAAATGLETWGLMGAPVLLLGPAWETRARAGAALIAATAILYGPFLLLGEVQTFSYSWEIADQTLVHDVLPSHTHFTWQLRLVQGALVVGAGGAIAAAMHRSPSSCWSVPLTVVAARLLIDPLGFDYYWLAAETLVLVGAAHLAASHLRPRTKWLCAGLLYPVLLHHPLPDTLLLLALLGGLAIVAALFVAASAAARPGRLTLDSAGT